MEAKAKVLGHAVHQMLIPYPLALLTTAIIFDVIHLFTGTPLWSIIARIGNRVTKEWWGARPARADRTPHHSLLQDCSDDLTS